MVTVTPEPGITMLSPTLRLSTSMAAHLLAGVHPRRVRTLPWAGRPYNGRKPGFVVPSSGMTEVGMDVLTDVFRTVRVQGEVFGCLDLTAPWGLRLGGCGSAIFHVVLRGDCWVRAGDEPVRAVGGEFLLLPS